MHSANDGELTENCTKYNVQILILRDIQFSILKKAIKKVLPVDLTLFVVCFSISVSEFVFPYIVGHQVVIPCTHNKYTSNSFLLFCIFILPLSHHDGSICSDQYCARSSAMQ